MKDIEILLASNSPRRRQLLSWTGLKYRVCPLNINEDILQGEQADDYVLRLAGEKARAAKRFVKSGEVILAADTIVVDNGEILGKPKDDLDAYRMLSQLRGRAHYVSTAVALLDPMNEVLLVDKCTSPVRMRNYSDEEINSYVDSKDPFDKAGGYAIQHADFQPVERFQDCFASVMGFPLCHFVRMMKKMGFNLPADVPNNCQTQLEYVCPVFDRILA